MSEVEDNFKFLASTSELIFHPSQFSKLLSNESRAVWRSLAYYGKALALSVLLHELVIRYDKSLHAPTAFYFIEMAIDDAVYFILFGSVIYFFSGGFSSAVTVYLYLRGLGHFAAGLSEILLRIIGIKVYSLGEAIFWGLFVDVLIAIVFVNIIKNLFSVARLWGVLIFILLKVVHTGMLVVEEKIVTPIEHQFG
jgi:hypothetical protein